MKSNTSPIARRSLVRHLSHLNLLFRKQLVAVWYLLHIPVLVTPMVSIPRLGITTVAATRSRSSIADVLVTLLVSEYAQNHLMLLQIETRRAHAAGFAFATVLAAVGNIVLVKGAMTAHMGRKGGFERVNVFVVALVWVQAPFHHL